VDSPSPAAWRRHSSPRAKVAENHRPDRRLEDWTSLAFPENGDYVFPEGLATVHIDHDADLGTYWEPNVWVRHHLGAS
jgi:hypothetical protein